MKQKQDPDIPAMIIILALLALTVGTALYAGLARAHESPGGMTYPTDCCDPVGRECSPIPDHAVQEVQGGYQLTLQPGEHPLLTMGKQRFYQHGAPGVRWSTDGERHACCKMTTADGVPYAACFCIIVPPPSF